MASVDSQNYSPILEKKNFKDLLEEDMVAVEEDLITKIFSQTIQVSPSDETAEGYDIRVNDSTDKEIKNGEDQLASGTDIEPEVEALEEQYDKVPTDFSHFNRTIIDLDEIDDVLGEQIHEIDLDKLSHTPSTASPVDEQSEIRDFEEIERIAENSEQEVIEGAMEMQVEQLRAVDETATDNDEIDVGGSDSEDPKVPEINAHACEDSDAVDFPRLQADTDSDIVSSEAAIRSATTRKTMTTVVSSTSSSSTTTIEQGSSIVESINDDGGSFPKKERKSKKVKKGRASEKENISVVPPRLESKVAQYSPSTIGIFCSVRELSKLYEEKQLISRPRRPFIKEDIMQINLNVKNMCRSFLDLTQYSATAATTTSEKQPPAHLSLLLNHNGHHSSEKKLFQRSKSIADLRRYQYHQGTFEQSCKVGGNESAQVSHQFSSSVFFLQKLLFFENWRRCTGGEHAVDDDNGPCKQVNCPHCTSFSLKSQESKGSLPPRKIRISIMQFDMKSSFSKFDALQKKAAAAAAAQPHASGSSSANVPGLLGQEQNAVRCTACEKVVYQMEQMKAENRFWHKNCFRCTTCNKPLSVDTYQSHEAVLYCKPHFKQLFSPKTVLDDETNGSEKKGPEMIIRESQPTELPEGVVRATDKVEDGLTLDDLHRLKNVKQAYEMFEKQRDGKPFELSSHKVEKSPSIINKLAQFQKKIARESNRSRRKGVAADDLNGEPGDVSDSSSCYSSGDDVPPEGVDEDLWRARKATHKIDPIPHCADLDDLKKKFEGGNAEQERRERQEERREEIKRIRSRLFMGKQAKIKEQYQQAVLDSEYVMNSEADNGNRRHGETVPGNIKDKMQQCEEPAVNTTMQKLLEMKSENQMELDELRRQKQRDNLEIKSKFESGVEKSPSYRAADDPEMMAQMVEKGIAKMSRNIFLEIDKQAAQQTGPRSPVMQPQPSSLRKSTSMVQTPPDVVNKVEGENGLESTEVVIDTKDLQKKFAFFEKYQEQDRSPKKTINVSKFKDTTAVKEMFENNQVQSNKQETNGDVVAVESCTTKRMLNLFRDIESGASNKSQPDGPRPLKAFTPPPDGGRRLYDDENGNGDRENGDSSPGVTDNSDIESEDEEEIKSRIGGKYDDEILQRAKQEARAQKLRVKFEKWETEQIKMEQEADQGRRELLDPTQESATNLRQKFEFMSKGDLSQNNSPRKTIVNRFV